MTHLFLLVLYWYTWLRDEGRSQNDYTSFQSKLEFEIIDQIFVYFVISLCLCAFVGKKVYSSILLLLLSEAITKLRPSV